MRRRGYGARLRQDKAEIPEVQVKQPRIPETGTPIRPLALLCAATCALCVAIPAGAGAASSGPMRALVIANSTYPALPALPGCEASAHTVGAALRRGGFDVTDKTNVSNGEMGSAIRALAAMPAPAAAVLYVCGYTVDYQGRDFLLPASAEIQRDTDALTQGLIAKSTYEAVAGSGAPAGLVLLDLVVAPQVGGTPHFDALTVPPLKAGIIASVSAETPPQGASAFAAAIAGALVKPDLGVGDAVKTIAGQSASPGITLSVGTPAAPPWLLGGPPAAAPAPPAPAVAAPPAVPDEAHMTDADRRRIQAALLRLGYYDKQADGIFGADTRAAIRRFQHEIGAEMTGEITPAQSGRLLATGK
jgi:Putative peptidoglycan binding domain/Caspase domain